MKQGKHLLENTILYAIGNFGSKILSFLIIPLYSHFLIPSSLGNYDVVITTLSLLQPIIIFQLTDGIYRWLIDSKKDKNRIIATTFWIIIRNVIIVLALLFILNHILELKYVEWIAMLLCVNAIFPVIQQITRGLEHNVIYVISGIANTLIMLSANFIGLIVLGTGIEILYISQILAGIIGIVLLIAVQPDLRNCWKYKYYDKETAIHLLKYSIPLIPNTICWWIVNSSDRYIILFTLGNSANGIYSLATKFPTILTTVTNIFYLAWQESAIKEYNSDNRDEFFSEVFIKYSRLLLTATMCLIPLTKIVTILFLGDAYTTSWKYTGFLYLGAVFSALCSFLGIGYAISKDTKRSLLTTNLAAIINIIINLITVSFIGLSAAALSTFISYLFLFIIRLKHTKRYFEIKFNKTELILELFICMIDIILTFILSNCMCVLLTIISVIAFLYLNRELAFIVINKLHPHSIKK